MKSFHLFNVSTLLSILKLKIFNWQAPSSVAMIGHSLSKHINTTGGILPQLLNSPRLSLRSKTMGKLFGKYKMKQKSHSWVTISNPCEFGKQEDKKLGEQKGLGDDCANIALHFLEPTSS